MSDHVRPYLRAMPKRKEVPLKINASFDDVLGLAMRSADAKTRKQTKPKGAKPTKRVPK